MSVDWLDWCLFEDFFVATGVKLFLAQFLKGLERDQCLVQLCSSSQTSIESEKLHRVAGDGSMQGLNSSSLLRSKRITHDQAAILIVKDICI